MEQKVSEQENFCKKLGRALESIYFAPVAVVYGLICWFFKLPIAAVYGYLAAFLLVLIFCENVKNVFIPLIYISYVIPDISPNPDFGTDTKLIFYGVAVGIAYISLIVVAAVRAKKKKNAGKEVKKGRLAFPFLLFSVGLVLAGAIGKFNALACVITLGFCVIGFVLYFIALNFTEGLTEALARAFLWGAAMLTFQLFLGAILTEYKPFVELNFLSAQNINTYAILISLGMVSCLYFGIGKNKDWLYYLLSFLYFLGVIETRCCMMMIISAVFIVALTVFFIRKSKKRINFLYAWLCILCVIGISFCFYDALIKPVAEKIWIKFNKNFWSGRDVIYNFAVEKFKEYPIFGYGFIASEGDPCQRGGLLLIHDTFLQWLCSTGIVGTGLSAFFYAEKYKIAFDKRNPSRVFTALFILVIALSGITDQAASMDIFYFLMPLLFIAAAETTFCAESVYETANGKKKELLSEITTSIPVAITDGITAAKSNKPDTVEK